MVAQTEDKWKRKYEDLLEEKEETRKKLASLEEKVGISLETVAQNNWMPYV